MDFIETQKDLRNLKIIQDLKIKTLHKVGCEKELYETPKKIRKWDKKFYL